MRADRADVLQRHGDADRRDVAAIEGEVAAVLEREAPAGEVAAEEVALLEELSGVRVVVDRDVGAEAVNFEVKIQLENPPPGVRPGFSASADITTTAAP